MNTDNELMTHAKAWIAGNISDEELRELTGCTLTDEELEEHIFIGGDPELAETHAALLCDAMVGVEFVKVLREWLTDAEWAEMRQRNAAERNDLVCHSHDHCDANMAMEAAFHRLGLKTTADLSQTAADTPEYIAANILWCAAWDWAKEHHLTAQEGL